MKYSDVVNSGLILPKKLKYTVKDADSVMQNSLFKPYKGRTFTPNEAAFIVRASAIHHGTDYSDALNTYGENVPKRNPAPKRKTAARTMKAAVGYVNRPSQITKKAPTKRLKKRRTVNLQSPRGVFPNPKARKSELTGYYTILKWKREKNTTSGNAVFSFVLDSFNGTRFEGKTKPNSDFVIGLPEFSVGDKIKATLSLTESGRLYMTDAEPMRQNPDSVHLDIDVNSHNAKGAKAKTRTNPARKKHYVITHQHKTGKLYFDGVGFTKLKESAVYFKRLTDVKKRAGMIADYFQLPMGVEEI